MNKQITIELTTKTPVKKQAIQKLAKKILNSEQCDRGINIVLTDDAMLKSLNSQYRSKELPTDVLSFPFDEADFLGEVYISIERAEIQAKQYGASLDEELERLVAHGILHLLGYTHEQMKPLMEKYLK